MAKSHGSHMDLGGDTFDDLLVIESIDIPSPARDYKKREKRIGAVLQQIRESDYVITVKGKMIAGNTKYNDFETIEALRDELVRRLFKDSPERLVFSIYPDRYWNALFQDDLRLEKINPKTANVELSFWVADACAHGLVTRTQTNEVNTIFTREMTLTVDGTKATPALITVEPQSDNGYLGLALKRAKTNDTLAYQIGVPDQKDWEQRQDDEEWLINDWFGGYVSEENMRGWEVNKGSLYINPQMAGVGRGGTVKLGTYYDAGAGKNISAWWATSYSDDMGASDYYGPTMYREIPADKGGVKGAKNWQVGANAHFILSNDGQLGMQQILVQDWQSRTIAGVVIYRNSFYRSAIVLLIVQGNIIERKVIDMPTTGNIDVGWNANEITFNKIDNRYVFRVGETYWTFNIDKDPIYEDARRVVLFAGRHKLHDPMAINLFETFTFRKYKVDYWYDIPNFMGKNDKLVIDAQKNTAELNGRTAVEYIDIASKPLLLQPGKNVLSIVGSDYAKPPKVTVEWKERWL